MAFFFTAVIVVFIQAWGATYALAMGYRFRYLQATVSKIEQAFGVDKYMPSSFKTRKIERKCSRLSLSIAPAILQVHVYFFVVSIAVVGVVSFLVMPYPYNAIVAALGSAATVFVFLMGACYYPKKLNRILDQFGQPKSEHASEGQSPQKTG